MSSLRHYFPWTKKTSQFEYDLQLKESPLCGSEESVIVSQPKINSGENHPDTGSDIEICTAYQYRNKYRHSSRSASTSSSDSVPCECEDPIKLPLWFWNIGFLDIVNGIRIWWMYGRDVESRGIMVDLFNYLDLSSASIQMFMGTFLIILRCFGKDADIKSHLNYYLKGCYFLVFEICVVFFILVIVSLNKDTTQYILYKDIVSYSLSSLLRVTAILLIWRFNQKHQDRLALSSVSEMTFVE